MADKTQPQSPAPPAKVPKKKGPIRWEAVLPFTIIVLLILLYFKLFFDGHLRKGLEIAGYHGIGAEVNVANLETSFLNASIRIRGIEVTDTLKPQQNSISIGDIRFGMLWDALLRGKVAIKEVAVEQIEFGKPRKSPGRIKPPEPVDVSNEPSRLEKEADKLKEQALSKTQEKYGDNVLGDVASLLSGTDAGAQAGKIEGTIVSKEMAAKLEAEMKEKAKAWQERLKALPQGKDFQALGDRLNKVKVKDFKSLEELQNSLKEFEAVIKDADAKYRQVNEANNDLNKDLQNSQNQMKDLENQIAKDIKNLESRFKIPRLDPKSLSHALFRQYLDPYLAKFNHYKRQAEKYVPPNVMKKGDKSQPDISMQPRPRDKGTMYEFGRPNSYPAFWIQRVVVSSQAGASPYAGNIRGEIKDITTNQALVGRPTVATFAGDFPSAGLKDMDSKLVIDNRKEKSQILFDFGLGAFPIEGRDLVNSGEVLIAFSKAVGQMKIRSELVGLRDFKLNLDNRFTQVAYNIQAANATADQILENVFAGIPVVTLEADGHGVLPELSLSINSNLGAELQRGVEKQIQAKIDEARRKIEAHINEQVGQHKAQIEAQYNQIKGQVEKELKKLQDQANSQKKTAENKTEQAKKDSENQGKKKVEDEAKKAAEDLKKKMGF